MAKLTLGIRMIELRRDGTGVATGTYEFRHPVKFLKAGEFGAEMLSYRDPGSGTLEGYENRTAAWKLLSMAIYGMRVLTFAMPSNPEIERYYRRHTNLGTKLDSVTILAFEDHGSGDDYYGGHPDYSIDIFDVTVNTSMLTIQGITYVGMYYSGATKEYF